MPISPSQREQALIRLVETHEQELLRLCCIYLGDAHLAQDAVQETFFKVYCHLDGFLGKCSEKTWLTRIAINTCRDIKKQRWFRFIDQSKPFENLPERASECTQEQIDLVLDIMRLPPKYKEVILLRYYQQMSLNEIADALRIAKRTVSYRLMKAHELLKIELGKEDVHE